MARANLRLIDRSDYRAEPCTHTLTSVPQNKRDDETHTLSFSFYLNGGEDRIASMCRCHQFARHTHAHAAALCARLPARSRRLMANESSDGPAAALVPRRRGRGIADRRSRVLHMAAGGPNRSRAEGEKCTSEIRPALRDTLGG